MPKKIHRPPPSVELTALICDKDKEENVSLLIPQSLYDCPVTPKSLQKYIENLLSSVAPQMLPKVLFKVFKRAMEGDTTAQKMVFSLYAMSPGSGTSVTTNIYNANGSGPATVGWNQASVVRNLASANDPIDITATEVSDA